MRASPGLNDKSGWVSSAYMTNLECKLVGKSAQYRVKKRGPRTEPWGTPRVISRKKTRYYDLDC